MNQCNIKGNVGSDPKITEFEGGGKVAQFSIATTTRGYETKDGRKIEDVTQWHDIVVNRKGLVGVVEKFIKKGTPVLVTGELRYRDYTDKDGIKRRAAEIYVSELELCGGGNGGKKDEAPAPAPDDFPF